MCLSRSLFSHLMNGAECLMKAVKKPKHQIMSMNINKDEISQLDSDQWKSDSFRVRRRRRALACVSVHACMCLKLRLLTGEVEAFKPSLSNGSLLFWGMRQMLTKICWFNDI